METITLMFLLAFYCIINELNNKCVGLPTAFNQRACEKHSKPGDIMIGGLMTSYNTGEHPCIGDVHSSSVTFAEAVVYAVDLVNERNDLLPNFTLGYDIRPTCGSQDVTLGSMLSLIKPMEESEYEKSCRSYHTNNNYTRNAVAVVGPGRSDDSVMAATVGRMFAVPVVSYAATSDELSNSIRFPFFFRTVPADQHQVTVMIDLLEHYNWKYVGLLYGLDSYGIHGSQQFSALAESAGICIAVNMAVSSLTSKSELSEMASSLQRHEKMTVFVIFTYNEVARIIFQMIKDYNIDRRFVFIASDALIYDESDTILQDYYDLLVDSIFIEFQNQASNFQAHYEGLMYDQERATPWYKKKLDEVVRHDNCTDLNLCSIPQPHPIAGPTIDAVHAVAFALNATIHADGTYVNGWALRQNLLNVSFIMNGNRSFEFDTNGDVNGRYELIMWQRGNDSKFKRVHIGSWSATSRSRLNLEEMVWGNQSVPISLCVEKCMPGYIQVPLEKKCCWVCQRCNDYAVVMKTDNDTKCKDCPNTHWPNANFTECLPIKPSYLEYRDVVFILSVAGSVLGIILTILAVCGFFVHADHPLIKASSPSLCFINLAGLIFLCLSVFLTLFQPTNVTCIVLEICISTSFCVTFTPVLLKVNRIWRIFSLELGDKLRLASTQSQMVISSISIGSLVSMFYPQDMWWPQTQIC